MKQVPTRLRQYEPLSRLGDYQIERHQIDPRGWSVLSPDGQTVGEVKDLVIDTGRMRARYLDVELDTKAFDLHDDPHVLVPMERARRDGDHRRLIVEGLAAGQIADLIEARDRHVASFWERWWSGAVQVGTPLPSDQQVDRRPIPVVSPPIAAGDPAPRPHDRGGVSGRNLPEDELRRALADVQPGEQVRIPVVEEEIVVERRPVVRDR